MDQAHVDALQAGLPGDRTLRLAHRLALHALDELAQLRLRDGQVGLQPLLVDDGREALHELAGNADHDLLRPEAGHLLGLLEGDRAVVDHGRDVGHRARLHVREPLALPTDALDGAAAVLDLEHERLGELGANVEGAAGGEGPAPLLPGPEASQDGHQLRSAERVADGRSNRLERGPDAVALRAPALAHLRPAATLAVDRADGELDEVTRGYALGHRGLVRGHEHLRLVAIERQRHHVRAQGRTQVLRIALHRLR